ncbi:MAG: hypothetical protein MUC45_11220, partial [Actinomycetia bacterium]|nr:hypothetical protein [Actinomycetes bacterium]
MCRRLAQGGADVLAADRTE